MGFACEHHKHRLRNILGQVRVAHLAQGHGIDQRQMPPCDLLKMRSRLCEITGPLLHELDARHTLSVPSTNCPIEWPPGSKCDLNMREGNESGIARLS